MPWPAEALQHWLHEARIATGPVFRAIDKWGNLGRRGLTPQSINLVLKSRCEKAGLDPAKYSAHGLRSGFLTEAANRGVPLQEAMQQSQHKSMAQAAAYYNEQDRRRGKAARVFI
jgi:integrase